MFCQLNIGVCRVGSPDRALPKAGGTTVDKKIDDVFRWPIRTQTVKTKGVVFYPTINLLRRKSGVSLLETNDSSADIASLR